MPDRAERITMLDIIIIFFLALFLGNGGCDQNTSASDDSVVQEETEESVSVPLYNYAIMKSDCAVTPVDESAQEYILVDDAEEASNPCGFAGEDGPVIVETNLAVPPSDPFRKLTLAI